MDGAHIAALDSLRSENGRLRRELDLAWRQVKDMKRFLNDYGMVWVGEDDPSRYIEIEDAAAHIPKEAAKDPRARALKEDPDKERLTVESMGIDPKAVEQHVERLNTNAGPSDPAVPLTIFR